ncbi:hypothetical protein [Streptomyces sp. HM190]|uniref:hypothetical protein n=1 Tax=Streptomyces sp. HM190 TaxID=2695266 RepID=UPI00135C5469|nr:hypothetical protein [Streptomyces sp. HM190]
MLSTLITSDPEEQKVVEHLSHVYRLCEPYLVEPHQLTVIGRSDARVPLPTAAEA